MGGSENVTPSKQIYDCFHRVGLCHYNVSVGSQDPLLENARTMYLDGAALHLRSRR